MGFSPINNNLPLTSGSSSQSEQNSPTGQSHKPFHLPEKNHDKHHSQTSSKKDSSNKKGKTSSKDESSTKEELEAKKKKQSQEVPSQSGELQHADQQMADATAQAAGAAQGMTPTAQIQAVHQLILKMVDSVASSKEMTQINLKSTSNVPPAFQGGQLTVQQTPDGMLIRFDNVKSEAAQLLEKGAQQLADQLANRGILNAKLQVGDNVIALPRPSTGPESPMQVAASAQQSFEREGGGQQGGGQQQGRQQQGQGGPR